MGCMPVTEMSQEIYGFIVTYFPCQINGGTDVLWRKMKEWPRAGGIRGIWEKFIRNIWLFLLQCAENLL
jgi:hypothetical protein